MTYALPLGHIAPTTHRDQETSFRMYWSFASDLWAIGATNTTTIGGCSLLRSSPQFAFANWSSMSVLTENRTLPSPLSLGLQLVASAVGPFNSIDMFVIPCPASATFFVKRAATALAHVLHVDAAAFSELRVRDVLQQIPPALLANGTAHVTCGNIFCGNDVAPYPSYGGLYGGFGADKLCHSLQLELLYPTARHVVTSILGMHAIYAHTVNFNRICALDTLASPSCAADHVAFWTYVTQTQAGVFTEATAAAVAAFADVQALNVSAVQFVTSATHDLSLFTTALFPRSDMAWSFYGYHFLYEWATGRREVVRFLGDAGEMTLLSSVSPLLAMPPSPIAVPWTFTWLLQLGCLYVTLVLIGVVGLGACHTLVVSRGQVEGFNLLCVNRLVGLVWVGRPLLLLRSITALVLLNTAPLTLVRGAGAVTYAISPPLPWYKTVLAAAEVTWLVYVLNDVLSCFTLQYTSTYAFKSANAALTIGAISTFLLPVSPVFHVARRCNAINMDDRVDCISANVAIGSIHRVYILMGLSTASILGCFALDRWRWPQLAPIELVSAALNAHSIYMLRLDRWKFGNEYFLDTTSAIMTGLLAWRHKSLWYVLDIKTWRLVTRPFVEFATTHDDGDSRRFQRAIPISRL
ncbi:hypothetical protein SDRG_03994 [Saprolegnia diclina VS20]|uniref:Uncharacterized protein n=1 Tax=Saprolegnia diclina (strain VS20) TaxID=1156394 RepID=T0S8S9_SAPDV|nr:hypothetical protein SDRG_03994 [Saprolegnia diclina VS20]EQC39042.1 hypothetical protein SDRG_03994 [Saprolegnia diclina VS20]|eukprot:XP_008607866.1 hypothetical protein SDRG_03994 [Saprolegnia diclina VS20]